jgi:hypothetical protein
MRTPGLVILSLVATLFAASGPARANEDIITACPVMSSELVKRVAAEISGKGQCKAVCKGCGCKGGPGYREPSSRRCVGFAELIKTCGPPPHKACTRECYPVQATCAAQGRSWLKVFATSIGLPVTYLASEVLPETPAGPAVQTSSPATPPPSQAAPSARRLPVTPREVASTEAKRP